MAGSSDVQRQREASLAGGGGQLSGSLEARPGRGGQQPAGLTLGIALQDPMRMMSQVPPGTWVLAETHPGEAQLPAALSRATT